MRDLIVTEFVSADGVMEAPGGEEGYRHAGWVWPHFGDQLGAYKYDEQVGADVLLLGRRTYDSFYGAWPQRDDPMAEKINSMRKLVASTTLGSSDWEGTEVVARDVEARVAEVKAEGGGPILVAGSRSIAHLLLEAGLVDEIHLQVFPVALRSGMRFWPQSADTLPLELTRSEAVGNGVLVTEYRVVRSEG